uniref:Uncharacterized protein n=1 Tax=Sphaerodactylus townsendi TaxID=933632 RepID=A0ACB8EAR2_9SAUR
MGEGGGTARDLYQGSSMPFILANCLSASSTCCKNTLSHFLVLHDLITHGNYSPVPFWEHKRPPRYFVVDGCTARKAGGGGFSSLTPLFEHQAEAPSAHAK